MGARARTRRERDGLRATAEWTSAPTRHGPRRTSSRTALAASYPVYGPLGSFLSVIKPRAARCHEARTAREATGVQLCSHQVMRAVIRVFGRKSDKIAIHHPRSYGIQSGSDHRTNKTKLKRPAKPDILPSNPTVLLRAARSRSAHQRPRPSKPSRHSISFFALLFFGAQPIAMALRGCGVPTHWRWCVDSLSTASSPNTKIRVDRTKCEV